VLCLRLPAKLLPRRQLRIRFKAPVTKLDLVLQVASQSGCSQIGNDDVQGNPNPTTTDDVVPLVAFDWALEQLAANSGSVCA
jgi:hypothetical protein